MNVGLLNPFAQNFPESVVATLRDAALCIRYNPTGRFVAAGRVDGWTTVWDAETRGIIRSLEGHVKPVVSVSWSRNSKYLLTGSKDWNCIVWDLEKGERRQTVRFDTPVLCATFHPRNSKILLVTLATHQTFLVDLRIRKGSRTELTDVRPLNGKDTVQTGNTGSTPINSTISRFAPDGKQAYVGTTQGSILRFSCRTKALLGKIKVANNSAIKHMEFDRAGRFLLVNSTDRIVRVYSIEDNPDPSMASIEPLHKFQDPIQRSPWNAVSFSGDGDWVLAGSANIAAHQLYIWDRSSGDLEKILEGPKDPLTDVDWHPLRPHIASLNKLGLIHLWGTVLPENYSAFAPGFEELDENVEYEEREDEFDLKDEDEERRKRQLEEEEVVNIDNFEPTESLVPVDRNGRARGGAMTVRAMPAAPGSGDPDDDWADADPDEDSQYDWFPLVQLDDDDDEDDVNSD